MKSKEEEGLYTEEQVETLIRITRVSTLIITLGFLLNTYWGTLLAKQLESYNNNLRIQLFNSFIAVIPAILAVYVAFNNEDEFVQSFNSEQ